MGKIISPTKSKETILEFEYILKDALFFEVENNSVTERVTGLTPMGYDNEIGLWEELESREQKRELLVKISQ